MATKKISRKKNSKRKRPRKHYPLSNGRNQGNQRKLIFLSCILLVVCIAFYPCLDNGFVNWDDDRNFYENPLIQNLNSQNFWKNTALIFQTPVIGNYNPLSIFTFALEKLAFGFDQPVYWHLDNLLLHLVCVSLVYFIGLSLGLGLPGAILLSLLFGIHPMRVESVAWLTERKDVLYGGFYLACILLYIQYRKGLRSRQRLMFIYLLFILSLLSKIQAVILPLSMLCIDFYLEKRIRWAHLWQKLPFFGISLFFGILGIVMLQNYGSLESNNTYPVYVRPFVGSFSFLVYIIKSIVPYKMVPLYPYPAEPPWYYFASIAIVPLFLWFCWRCWKRDNKVVLFGLAFFTFNIVFLLQILGAGQGFVADRFTYIPYFGLFFIGAYYFERIISEAQLGKTYYLSGAVAILLTYGYITHGQTQIWKNGETLWTHVLTYYDNITLPFGNRANYYRDQGMYAEALVDYSALISLKQDHAAAYNSRAKLYFNSNSADTLRLALSDYQRAVELEPHNGEYLINRGAAYARLNMLQNALNDLNSGLSLEPTRDSGYLNRSVVQNMLGNLPAAIEDMNKYLEFHPNSADIYFERGRANYRLGKLNLAFNDLSKAIALNPNKGIYFKERSGVNLQLGQRRQARSDALAALELNEELDTSYLRELGI